MILAKRPRSDAEPRTFGVCNETKITKAFEWSYSYQVSLGFRCFIQVPRLRYVPRNCIGPKFWPQWRRILSILPALLCQLWQWNVLAGGKRFIAWLPSLFTCLLLTTQCRGRWSKSKKVALHMSCKLQVATTNCNFSADLGHLHLHRIPKILLHFGTTALSNLIWIQDAAVYFCVRCRGILKLSTHTE